MMFQETIADTEVTQDSGRVFLPQSAQMTDLSDKKRQTVTLVHIIFIFVV
jgi:hypothetical protein